MTTKIKRREFIELVRSDLALHGIRFTLVNASSLDKKYAGWFDSVNRKLVIAQQHKDFFSILLHEYCHFRQWLENRQHWNKLSCKSEIFFEWLDSRKPITRKMLDAKNATQALEHDCERRAIAMIKKLDLPLSVNEYSQKANAYLLSYHLMATYHRWPMKKSVYATNIRKHMSVKLLPLRKISNEATLTEDMLKIMTPCFG